MAYSLCAEPRPGQVLGTNELYETGMKCSQYTWTRTGWIPIVRHSSGSGPCWCLGPDCALCEFIMKSKRAKSTFTLSVNSAMMLAMLFWLKTMESPKNGLEFHCGATALFWMRTASLPSSQICYSVDSDARSKRPLKSFLDISVISQVPFVPLCFQL